MFNWVLILLFIVLDLMLFEKVCCVFVLFICGFCLLKFCLLVCVLNCVFLFSMLLRDFIVLEGIIFFGKLGIVFVLLW